MIKITDEQLKKIFKIKKITNEQKQYELEKDIFVKEKFKIKNRNDFWNLRHELFKLFNTHNWNHDGISYIEEQDEDGNIIFKPIYAYNEYSYFNMIHEPNFKKKYDLYINGELIKPTSMKLIENGKNFFWGSKIILSLEESNLKFIIEPHDTIIIDWVEKE